MANGGDFFSAEIQSFIAAESVVQESEDELDAIMLAACLEGFDAPPTTTNSAQSTGHASLQCTTHASLQSHTHFRFAPPKSQSQIDRARLDRIPTKTKDDTTYCHKLWKTWREYRQTRTGENIPSIETDTYRTDALAE